MKFVKPWKLKSFPKDPDLYQGHADRLVIPGAAAWLHAPHQNVVLRNVKNTGIWKSKN